MYEEEKYFLVVNAINIEKDWDWLNVQNKNGAILENSSERISQIAIQGPRAMETLQKICAGDLSQMKYYTFRLGPVAGVNDVIVSATGYTGAGGFELYFYNPDAEKIWDAVMEAGQEFGIKPVGLAARDTLRLEMGFCLYGNDIDETTSPLEAGLGWITRFVENNDFIDRGRLERQKREGTGRRLVGFTMREKGIPRQHYKILGPDGNHVGEVTSGSLSPMMNVGIGLGYVKAGFEQPGTTIFIQVRNKQLEARVVKLPIYRNETQY
jgi:aminomethyltransferase